jgi:hypothetical protein
MGGGGGGGGSDRKISESTVEERQNKRRNQSGTSSSAQENLKNQFPSLITAAGKRSNKSTPSSTNRKRRQFLFIYRIQKEASTDMKTMMLFSENVCRNLRFRMC